MFIATADLRMLHARDVAERTGAGGAAASGLKTDSDIAAGSRALHGRELQQAASSWLTPPPDELDGGLGECAAAKTAGADLNGVAAVASMLASVQRGECRADGGRGLQALLLGGRCCRFTVAEGWVLMIRPSLRGATLPRAREGYHGALRRLSAPLRHWRSPAMA